MEARMTQKTRSSALLAAAVLVLVAGPAGTARAAILPLVNGNFEAPFSLPAGSFDQVVPTGWTTFEGPMWAPAGASGYGTNRVGAPAFGFPPGANGPTIIQIGNDFGPAGLYQDLGTMVAGETYAFSTTISHPGAGVNEYRFSFIGDYVGAPLATPAGNILASITQADFTAPAGGSTVATFGYTATGADNGKNLRLQLEGLTNFQPPESSPISRTGVDDVTVTGGATPPATGLWSVDLQATGALPMSGVEPAYGYGNVWNMVEAPHHTAITPSKSQALNDSDGAATGATFSVLTPFSTLNAVGFDTVLTQDFFLFGAGSVSQYTSLDWEISGLTPGAEYEMYNYRAPVVGRDFFMSIDTDGDGIVDALQSIVSTVTGSGAADSDRGALFSSLITADPSGLIRGQLAGGGEVNWSGFQLRRVSQPGDIPEPATMAMLALAFAGLGGYVRRRKQGTAPRRNKMTATKTLAAFLAVGMFLGLGGAAQGAIVLTNGSFENTGVLYNGALGGLYEASGWTNLSGLNIQASSMLAGQEGTNAAGVTGARFLRLVSDNPHPANTGSIVQNLGTMVAGETYTFAADALGGGSVGHAWGATASLVSDGTGSPATVYASQFVDGLVAGQVSAGAYNFSYSAVAADAGNPLFVQLEAKPSGAGQATRGGIDNVTVTGGTPPPLTGLWSVDLQATGALPMSGVEPAYGYGNVWNMVEAPHWTVLSPSKSQALHDSDGAPTGATFSVLTPLSTLNAVGFDTVLTQDFFLFGVGNLPNQMDWEISGLTPGAEYEMYNYRAPVVGRDFFMSIDTDGDGIVDTMQSIVSTVTGSGASDSDRGALFSSLITADPSGLIRGQLAGGGEVNWSGFQLRMVSGPGDIPEPATIVLAVTGLAGLLGYARRRRKA